MNKEIRKILENNKTKKQKENALDLLSENIKLAKLILSDDYLYELYRNKRMK